MIFSGNNPGILESAKKSSSRSARQPSSGAQLQLWSEPAPEWIQPGGINRLATCLTQQAHGRFSATRMQEGYLGLVRSGLETVQLTLEGKLPESPKGNTMSETVSGTTIYQRIGGEAAIQRTSRPLLGVRPR